MARPVHAHGRLTYVQVARHISYDPATGVFTRLRNGRRADTLMTIGYRRVRLNVGKHQHEMLAHRLAWLFLHREWPENEIDHINGDKSDNRAANIRHVTRKQNARNLSLRSDNRSGVAGVNRHQNGWKVRGAKSYLAYSGCFGRALRIRKAYEMENSYHENHGRR